VFTRYFLAPSSQVDFKEFMDELHDIYDLYTVADENVITAADVSVLADMPHAPQEASQEVASDVTAASDPYTVGDVMAEVVPNTNTMRKRWTVEEEHMLTSAVKTFGTTNWPKIAANVGRNKVQCKSKWSNMSRKAAATATASGASNSR
jgi:hypothetical protein